MSYLEELLPEFRKGAKIRMKEWNKSFYCEMRNGKVYNQDGHKIKKFSHEALFENVWEFYSESIDWQYIIDNKCLCFFWDHKIEYGRYSFLNNVHKENSYPYEDSYIDTWIHCRPVRRDEVTFYEDKKDD